MTKIRQPWRILVEARVLRPESWFARQDSDLHLFGTPGFGLDSVSLDRPPGRMIRMGAVIPTEREATAAHEAGHAVMRWVRGLPATPISLMDDRLGKCSGTGRLYPVEDVLLVTVAGYAAESALGAADVDFSGACGDFDYARRLFGSTLWLRRPAETLDQAIERYFWDACELLRPHRALIHRLRDMLLSQGQVPAQAVAATCAASATDLFSRGDWPHAVDSDGVSGAATTTHAAAWQKSPR